MGKMYSKALVAILVSTLLLSLASTSFSATITNRHTLAVVAAHTVNGDGTLTVLSTDFVYSDPVRTKWDSTAQGNLLAINLTGMTITGAQVWLWISEQGGAVIEANDSFYAGPFALNHVFASVANYLNVTDPYSGETFWVGNNMIIGPITTNKVVPKGVSYYVKITDVSPATASIPSSDVAVSLDQWLPYESITVSPSQGPAGTIITVKGVAWDSAKMVNISWASASNSLTDVVVGPIAPDANGVFSVTFTAKDLKIINAINATMYVNAYYNVTGATVLDYGTFVENGRRWEQVNTYIGAPGAGNGYVNGNVEIFDDIYVAGRYWWANGILTLYWDWGTSSQLVLASNVTLAADGFFNITVTVPEAGIGWHTISAVDSSFNLNASVNVIPTLILVPNRGPVGTNVTAYGYGFPSTSGSAVYNVTLVWDGFAGNTRVANGSTDALGKFVFHFIVPHDFGGYHDVDAFLTDANGNLYQWMADDQFYVTAVLVITPNKFANNCTLLIIANGSGFKAGEGFDGPPTFYEADLDNQHLDVGGVWDYDGYLMSKLEGVTANGTGDLSFAFVGCGFLPGLHVVSLYEVNYISEMVEDGPIGEASVFQGPAAWACFEVTAEGDLYAGYLNAINSTIQDVLISVADDVATIKTDVGTLKVSAAALDAKVVALQGDVAVVKTTLGLIQGNITAINGNVATVATNVGQIKADTSAIAGVGGTVSGLTLPVYAAVVLSLIAAIAAIYAVISLRGKLAA